MISYLISFATVCWFIIAIISAIIGKDKDVTLYFTVIASIHLIICFIIL